MGLIDFVKSAGEKLMGLGGPSKEEQEAAVAAKLEQIESMGFETEDLNITFMDGVATVSGIAHSQEIREKIVLLIGNTEGVGQVDDNMRVRPPLPDTPPEPEATFYTVESGDTLWKIADQHYGNGSKYPVIFEANKPMLEDPDKIYPGQVLRIPPLDED